MKSNSPPLFFVSYATQDTLHAQEICRRVEQLGARCWIASQNIQPGIPYAEALIKAIDECDALILILSDNSNRSPFVGAEVERAFSKGKRLFPIRIGNVLPAKALEFFISSVQWVDSWEPSFQQHLKFMCSAMTRGGAPVLQKEVNVVTRENSARGERWSIREFDITRLEVNAIVIPTSDQIGRNEGLQGLIRLIGGPRLDEYCRKVGGTGAAFVTPGFGVSAKYMIQVPVPLWDGNNENMATELAACYNVTFSLANRSGIRQIAFPVLGAGSHNFPLDLACSVAVREVRKGIERFAQIEKITLVARDQRVCAKLRVAANEEDAA